MIYTRGGRVLLINPGQIFYPKTFRGSLHGSLGLPVGLLYVAAALRQQGCTVQIVDIPMEESARTEKRGDGVVRGIPAATLRGHITRFAPDLVGIASQFSSQEEMAVEAARLVKEVRRDLPVVMGGANAACRQKELLATGVIDTLVAGEGEGALAELLSLLQRGGVLPARLQGRGPDDLDSLPLPAYDLLPMEKYLTLYRRGIATRDRDVRRAVPLITSRGCPYGCIFCAVSQTMGRRWRGHSPGYIRRHIGLLVAHYHVRHIHFEDDNLFYDPDRFMALLEALAAYQLTWDTPNGVRADLRISEAMLERMKKSGCRSLTVAVESGDDRVRNTIIHKQLDLTEVREFARRCHRAGILLRAFFIMGIPGETEASMEKTSLTALSLAREFGVEIINLIATPLYGTELFDLCLRQGYLTEPLTPRALSESTAPDGRCLIRTESFSPATVERLSRLLSARAYRRMFFQHPYRTLKRIGNAYVFLRALKRVFALPNA